MRVLIIAYYFPPDAAIGAVRPYQFARLLPEHGIETWVLTVEPEFAETWDEQFVIDDIPAGRIIRTRVGATARDRLVKSLASLKAALKGKRREVAKSVEEDAGAESSSSAQDNGWMAATARRRLLLSWIRFPDELAGWYQPALKAAELAHQEFNFDALVSTSPPRVSHLIARRLAIHTGLPWVMDLRDPWYDEWNADAPQSKSLLAQYRRLFKKCARRADTVVLNTERLREYVVRTMPELVNKAIAIPNGCSLRPSTAPLQAQLPDKFSIGHYGNVYDQRSSGVFLEGLRRWLDESDAAQASLAVHFVGQEFGDTAERVAALNLDALVQLRPPVPRQQVLELMRADYALLLIANGQPVQVPGKLYEYLSSGRRILATTEQDSATADLLRGTHDCLIAQTAGDVAAALQTLWREYEQGRAAEVDHSRLLDECSYPRRTERLADALKSLRRAEKVKR